MLIIIFGLANISLKLLLICSRNLDSKVEIKLQNNYHNCQPSHLVVLFLNDKTKFLNGNKKLIVDCSLTILDCRLVKPKEWQYQLQYQKSIYKICAICKKNQTAKCAKPYDKYIIKTLRPQRKDYFVVPPRNDKTATKDKREPY